MEKYIEIKEKNLPKMFMVIGNKIYLKNSRARPFSVNLPLELNEDLAKIPAMILDGTVSKDLRGFMFSQKKDKTKPVEFFNIIKRFFGIKGRFSICKSTGTHRMDYSSKTLTSFLHYCLDIHKSDQPARIPRWIWKSPESVLKEYLRYAFAMEASVEDYRKGNTIRFHSCNFPYMEELKSLLKSKYDINSKIQKYYIKDYGWKYYLYFQDAENVTKFYDKIGFALNTHQERLRKLVENLKPKAWQVTLVKILDLKRNEFDVGSVNGLFSYLHRRAIHQRLSDLAEMGFLRQEKQGYSLTDKGHKTVSSLKDKVRIVSLRTNTKTNEEQVIRFLKSHKKGYRNEIARELGINVSTTRDTLKRLVKKGAVQFKGRDKFQRRFYGVED